MQHADVFKPYANDSTTDAGLALTPQQRNSLAKAHNPVCPTT